MNTPKHPILDWSKEGRQQYWKRYAESIETHLSRSFKAYMDEYEITEYLKPKERENPVQSYIDFVERRFTKEELDPNRCKHSISLFRQTDWWLSQKVGL